MSKIIRQITFGYILKRATNIENEIAPAADFAGIPPLLPAKSSGHFKIEIPLVYFHKSM
jgi:hypothetical protein